MMRANSDELQIIGYHGTTKQYVKSFREGVQVFKTEGAVNGKGLGFYTTPSINLAKTFAMDGVEKANPLVVLFKRISERLYDPGSEQEKLYHDLDELERNITQIHDYSEERGDCESICRKVECISERIKTVLARSRREESRHVMQNLICKFDDLYEEFLGTIRPVLEENRVILTVYVQGFSEMHGIGLETGTKHDQDCDFSCSKMSGVSYGHEIKLNQHVFSRVVIKVEEKLNNIIFNHSKQTSGSNLGSLLQNKKIDGEFQVLKHRHGIDFVQVGHGGELRNLLLKNVNEDILASSETRTVKKVAFKQRLPVSEKGVPITRTELYRPFSSGGSALFPPLTSTQTNQEAPVDDYDVPPGANVRSFFDDLSSDDESGLFCGN